MGNIQSTQLASVKQNNRKTPLVIVIDGIIGAGKSSYIQIIVTNLRAKGYKVTVVKELVDKWVESGILQKYYSDVSRYAYQFQTVAFVDRINENIKMFTENPDTDIYILERSPISDKFFMELLHQQGKITDLEMKNYLDWSSLWYRLMPYTPTHFIYLRPSILTCMNRLKGRNRNGEENISEGYQIALQEKHDKFFSGDYITVDQTKAKFVILNTDENFKDDLEIQTKMTNAFEHLIQTL